MATIILLGLFWRKFHSGIRRTVCRSLYRKEKELTRNVIELHGDIVFIYFVEALKRKEKVLDKSIRKELLNNGKVYISESNGAMVPLHYAAAKVGSSKNDFDAVLEYNLSQEGTSVISYEIIRWKEINGVTTKRCVEAMQGLGELVLRVAVDVGQNVTYSTFSR